MTDKEKVIYNIVVIKEMIKIRSTAKNIDEKLEKIGLTGKIIEEAVRKNVLSNENLANIINKSPQYGFKKEYFYTNKNCEFIIDDEGIQKSFESYQVDDEIKIKNFKDKLSEYCKLHKKESLELIKMIDSLIDREFEVNTEKIMKKIKQIEEEKEFTEIDNKSVKKLMEDIINECKKQS